MTFLVFSSPRQFFPLKSYVTGVHLSVKHSLDWECKRVNPGIVAALGLGLQGCQGTSPFCAKVCPEPHSKLQAQLTSCHFGKDLCHSWVRESTGGPWNGQPDDCQEVLGHTPAVSPQSGLVKGSPL